jgi:hypothetical protein
MLRFQHREQAKRIGDPDSAVQVGGDIIVVADRAGPPRLDRRRGSIGSSREPRDRPNRLHTFIFRAVGPLSICAIAASAPSAGSVADYWFITIDDSTP